MQHKMAEDQGVSLFAAPKRKRRRASADTLVSGVKKELGPTPTVPSNIQKAVDGQTVRPIDDAGYSSLPTGTLDPHSAAESDQQAASPSDPAAAQQVATPEPTAGGADTDADADGKATVSFRDLGVSDWLDKVCRGLGMTHPTQVQRGCIPAILAGRDVIGTAHTGSGKTAAFALPILQALARDPFGVFALVLTPTRELAFQLAEQFRALGAGMSLKDLVIVGGLDMQAQAKDLARRPHVVVATPGRLKGLVDNDAALGAGFSRTRFLVLDEADRLLDPSFQPELRAILQLLPQERQTLLFSATMTRSLTQLQQAALQDAFHFQAYDGLETVQQLKESYLFLPAKVKEVYLYHLLLHLAEHKVRSAIVFASTCKGCHMLDAVLRELDIPCVALHSHKTQKRRLAALHTFKSGVVPILLATDVASRGLDIPTVDLVVNLDLPIAARDYVHRVGRTARAGRQGWSLSFVTQYDVELVQGIEELVGHQLEAYEMEESEVLKGITKVFSARRAAAMKVAEEQDRKGGSGGTSRDRKRSRQLQAA